MTAIPDQRRYFYMKTLKRILALMTALVLCLAPTALMVGASAGDMPRLVYDGRCERCLSSNVTYQDLTDSLYSTTIVGEETRCQRYKWLVGHWYCKNCNHYESKYEFTYSNHPTLYYNEEGNMRFCAVCGYEEYINY